MRRTTILRKLTFSGIVCAALFGGLRSGFAGDNVQLALQDLGHGAYHIEGWFSVDVPLPTAWDVLTDYDAIDTFVSSLHESRIVEAHDRHLLLEQIAVGKAFFLSRRIHVLLRVQETPRQRIDFEDVAHKDFVSYRGVWEVRPTLSGLDVLYTLDCHRRFKVPNFLAKDALRKSAKSLLSEVKDEILRRHQGGTR